MNQGWQNLFEEDDSTGIINRYKNMLNKKRSCYFDIHEFENIVDYFINHSDYKSAAESVKTGLKQHPGSVSLKLKYAHVLIESGKSPGALTMLDDIEKVEVYNYEVHLLKGKALNTLRKQKDAIREFQKAIELSNESKDDLIYDIALSFIQIEMIDTAIKYLLTAYEINNTNLLVIYDLALCYERMDNIEKSIYYYNRFLDIDPFAENIWFNLGLLYSSINENKLALRAYDYSIAICPDNISVYFSKADTLITTGSYYDAIKVYRELLDIDSKNTHAYCCIGECYEKLGEYKPALRNYLKATKLESSNSEAWYGMGVVCFNLKKYHYSINYLKKAVKIEPDNSEYWFSLGEVYSRIKAYDKSENAYSRTLDIDPGNYKCWLAYAEVYYSKNRIVDAISILQKGYKYNHNISTMNYQLAAYHIYNDQTSLACKYFEKGLSLNYKEHNKVLEHFPKARENKDISRLILKYRNQK